jgi:DNA-binding NarL/FixJ family response regulator
VLVEDDAHSRRLLRELLEAEGFSVVGEAGDGRRGVDLVHETDPDIVLMDLRMPGMGGIEATRLIKESSPLTQILILTAYDGSFPARSAKQVGAYAYLVKGCRPDLIRDVLLYAWRYKAGLEASGHSSLRPEADQTG